MPVIKSTYFKLFFCIILFSFSLTACKQNRLDVNVSNIDLNIKVNRFEKDFFAIDTNNVAAGAAALKKKYPDFYPIYFERLMRLGVNRDSSDLDFIKMIKANKDFNTLKHDVDSVYPTITDLENQITDAFKHYKYYFPDAKIPEVLTYISDFQVGATNTDQTLGIELDMFLGKNYKYYPSVGFPNYLTRKLGKEYITAIAMKGFAKQHFSEKEGDKSLLNKMIYEGKILYFLDAVLPKTPDSIKIGFSQKQLDWCNAYKVEMWANFLDQNLLYSTDELKYSKYLNDAPFTSGLDNDSAPQLGIWTGWQIVRKYMNENTNVTVAQLMNDKDYQKILKLSKYKPKK
ncbi:gliding motility lipoprotein GldB [Solitalea koreensis]|uniref:Gliding motility-associated lipoprotein GldB n=1 Tax=Solitalea koreensis TaxID=543615 RepID=A0A521ATB2_9SPHI|nr:gliding motility lipoprotein GldB [Solitalea koreensis]SMO37971.1 gliding motility-associated lipoprotein GldB [Solitalea koreensis]